MSGAERIAAERKRQIAVEGYDAEYDDGHSEGSIAKAADAYYNHANGLKGYPKRWPWGKHTWSPSDDPARTLEKAGALYQAEIDRLTRLRDCCSEEIDQLARDEQKGDDR